MSSSGSERIRHLDSLRGLAALSVVWSHFGYAYGIPRPVEWALTNTPLHILWDGFAAVSFFFVLSGLVLTRRYFREPARFGPGRFHLLGFFASRICRIWLPFLAVLMLSLLARETLYGPFPATVPRATAWLTGHWQYELSAGHLLHESALLMARPMDRLIPQDWTLTVELYFSLMIPLLVLLTMRGIGWLLAFVAMAFVFFGFPVYLFHFTLGVLIARYYTGIATWVGARSAWAKAGLLAVSVLLYTFRFTVPVHLPGWFSEPAIWSITAVGGAGFIVACCGSASLRSALERRWLLFLGRISYSLYLCHFIVLLCASPWILDLVNQLGVHRGGAARLLTLAGVTLVAVVLSELLYRVVEEPSIRAGHWLNDRLLRGGASARSVAP